MASRDNSTSIPKKRGRPAKVEKPPVRDFQPTRPMPAPMPAPQPPSNIANVNIYGAVGNDEDDIAEILQQINDAEMAMAMDASFASEIAMRDNDFTSTEQIPAPQRSHPAPLPVDNQYDVDDIQSILEQIEEMEAKEQVKKNGYAYQKPLSIDRMMANMEKEDKRIREEVAKKISEEEWRAERKRQDEAYQASLRKDEEKCLLEQQQALQKEQQQQVQVQPPQSNDDDEEIIEDIPKTREELRLARLKFLTKSK